MKAKGIISYKELSDDDLVKGIRDHDNDVLRYIYKKYFEIIRNFIKKNNGNDEDAQDIFQESIIIIFKKIQENSLELTCSFGTFIFSICRLLWLKQLEKRRIRSEENTDDDDLQEILGTGASNFEYNDEYKLYQEHFSKLPKDCQRVLRLFLEKVPLKEVAEIMGYKSEQYAKKRKFECKEKLIENIKSDLSMRNIEHLRDK